MTTTIIGSTTKIPGRKSYFIISKFNHNEPLMILGSHMMASSFEYSLAYSVRKGFATTILKILIH